MQSLENLYAANNLRMWNRLMKNDLAKKYIVIALLANSQRDICTIYRIYHISPFTPGGSNPSEWLVRSSLRPKAKFSSS